MGTEAEEGDWRMVLSGWGRNLKVNKASDDTEVQGGGNSSVIPRRH